MAIEACSAGLAGVLQACSTKANHGGGDPGLQILLKLVGSFTAEYLASVAIY